jgi:hypothetical protein
MLTRTPTLIALSAATKGKVLALNGVPDQLVAAVGLTGQTPAEGATFCVRMLDGVLIELDSTLQVSDEGVLARMKVSRTLALATSPSVVSTIANPACKLFRYQDKVWIKPTIPLEGIAPPAGTQWALDMSSALTAAEIITLPDATVVELIEADEVPVWQV